MFKRIQLIIISFFMLTLMSCTKKSVQIPLLDTPGIQEVIYDNTQIWMFYNDETPTPTLEINAHNKISGTHWIFNIDKRLPMRWVVPELKKLLAKRNKPGMHNSDKVLSNYFSYVDSVNNALSMIRFDSINFQMITAEDLESNRIKDKFELRISQSSLTINGTAYKVTDLNSYFKARSEGDIAIQLSFDDEIDYGRYLSIKARLSNLTNKRVRIKVNERIVSQ